MAYLEFKTLKNCTSNLTSVATDKYVADGTYLTILLYANEGYNFKSGYSRPKCTYKNYVDYFTLNEDATQATFKINNISGDAIIEATAHMLQVPLETDLHHATTNINTTYLLQGETYTISIKADDGYYFTSEPTINGEKLTPIESDIITEYTISYKVPTSATKISLYASADVIPSEEIKKFGIIKIFNPTNEELEDISNTRFYRVVDTLEWIDLGKYISHLFKLFINIPEYPKESVKLGGYDTSIECSVVQNDVIKTNCGQINLQGKFNNALDYENTEIEIYLPFVGFQNLEPSKVMNKTLKLFYITSLISGESIIYINDENDITLYTFTCNVGYEVPYRVNGEYKTNTPLNVSNGYLHGFKPFLNIRTNKTNNTAHIVANDDRETIIKNEIGFISCSLIFNTIKCTLEEREEINRVLESGILI